MRWLLIALTILVSTNSWGQVTDTLYLDTLYQEVESKLKAKYFRIIIDYNSSVDRFHAIDLNKYGKKVFDGHLRFVNSSFPDGDYLFYFDNGSIRLKGRNRNVFGKDFEFEEELWHPNGIKQGNTSFKKQFFIHNLFDTLGRQQVIDGNGRCTFISYFDKSIYEGNVNSGKKDGLWTIYDFKGTVIARETYREGNLIRGFRIKEKIDSIPYRHFGMGDDVMITRSHLKNQFLIVTLSLPGRLVEGYSVLKLGFDRLNLTW